MRVRVLRPRVFMDAGVERLLDAEGVYELPDVVARALIATGAAAVEEAAAVAHEVADEAKSVLPPETKPMLVLETKSRRSA